MTELNRLNRKAVEIRKSLLEMIYEAGTGHTGSSLSNTDILVALYYGVMKIDPNNPNWEERDRYIQSKGHAVESYWAVLADKGFFPKEELKTFSKYNSRLIGHPNNKVPGVEMNTGALGHGLSVSVGMALSAKMDKKTIRVFTLMGDGELAEGSVWEAAMSAAQYKLDNLIGIIDRNRLQISGTTDDVMSNEPLDKKWESFGWHVIQVDGNDVGELVRVFNEALQITGKLQSFWLIRLKEREFQ
ncbi:transketolase [Halalkalibacter hemicellulosilyticusJCM 9152]|uniref:Transketolase n=1 Tax=Halalkalibacter hemicellulosilyticusJCM 9152 TaxID=1236971 RepID=W4QJM1_9BACI|nr:transketolase [Halalkalibacter hemicellulosilyticusJCM 9152]